MSLGLHLFSVLILVAGASVAQAGDARDQEIADTLRKFQADPASVLNSLPVKTDAQGNVLPRRPLITDEAGLLEARTLVRTRIMARSKARALRGAQLADPASDLPGLPHDAIDLGSDDPAKLVESPEQMSRKLEQMEEDHLTSGKADGDVWSDHYWPYYLGVTANRYGDPAYLKSKDWNQNYSYVTAPGHSLAEIWQSANSQAIDYLSPAEKYDAVTGNLNGALTESMWNITHSNVDTSGVVEDWMGICEGWTAAAIRTSRPSHPVQVSAADGKQVSFYPSDVKALTSILWSRTHYDSRFAGGRCNQKDPATDENGRILDPDCFDTNPATWHLAVTHQLGRLHSSFALDATYDYEVWNQPALSYSYSYFNPQTGQPVQSLAQAEVKKAEFTADKFRKYRSPKARSFVGIVMDFVYVAENEDPTQTRADSAALDVLTSVRYMYDLELDVHREIIGGEWYINAHPDFLWMPEPGEDALSVAEDEATSEWTPSQPVPASWAGAAAHAATSEQPLAKVVKALHALAAPAGEKGSGDVLY